MDGEGIEMSYGEMQLSESLELWFSLSIRLVPIANL